MLTLNLRARRRTVRLTLMLWQLPLLGLLRAGRLLQQWVEVHPVAPSVNLVSALLMIILRRHGGYVVAFSVCREELRKEWNPLGPNIVPALRHRQDPPVSLLFPVTKNNLHRSLRLGPALVVTLTRVGRPALAPILLYTPSGSTREQCRPNRRQVLNMLRETVCLLGLLASICRLCPLETTVAFALRYTGRILLVVTPVPCNRLSVMKWLPGDVRGLLRTPCSRRRRFGCSWRRTLCTVVNARLPRVRLEMCRNRRFLRRIILTLLASSSWHLARLLLWGSRLIHRKLGTRIVQTAGVLFAGVSLHARVRYIEPRGLGGSWCRQ